MKHTQQRISIVAISFVLLIVFPIRSVAQSGPSERRDETLIKSIQQGHDDEALAALVAGANGESMGVYTPPHSKNIDKIIQEVIHQNEAEVLALQEKIRIMEDYPNEDAKVQVRRMQDKVQQLEEAIRNPSEIISFSPVRIPALLLLLRRNGSVGPKLTLVSALLNHGADIEDRDAQGCTPLCIASFTSLELTRLLLDRGAAVNTKDNYGMTPLMLASVEETKLLLDHGAMINATDKYHQTALIIAASHRQVDKVRMLLEHGADVSARNISGMTALDVVTESYRTDSAYKQIADILRQHGAK